MSRPGPISAESVQNSRVRRRTFLTRSALALLGASTRGYAAAQPASGEPIIDIHQHLGYRGRPDHVLVAHQRAMGATKTILLPAGRPARRPSTHGGVANGLQADALGNEACDQFVRAHREAFLFGANDVPDLTDATREIGRYLKRGAIVIGEQKFGVECDSAEMQKIYALAREYDVPVLMHWQFKMYNLGFERFHKMLEKYPKVNFIGHAQTWWANIDKGHADQSVLYPKTKVTPGGLTERYLSEYPNMYGDMSAGSGLNSMMRDEEHARWFIKKHQDKLLYGSDCNDRAGTGPTCQGWMTIQTIGRLAPDEAAKRKILFDNAGRMFRLA